MALGLEVFIGGDASELRKTLREADYKIKGFINQNRAALRSMENLGAPASIAFTGLTLALGVAAKKFGDFEATLNRVAAVSNASAAELGALKKKAEELGAATKFSNQEAAAGMEELAKAGLNTQQIMDTIPGVLQMAAAGGMAVADAAALASGTLRAFNLDMSESGRVADVLAQAANQSSVDMADLQLSMKYAGTGAAAANQSLEEVTGALAIMGNAMVKGEQAGTTLRAAFVRLQAPPKEAAETLAKLGVSVADAQGKMRPLGDIIDQLRTKTAGMTDVQRNAAIANIFGTEAMSGMLALVRQSPAQYDAMVASMRDAEGAAKKMSDTINSGFNGSMDQLMASAESAATAIGESLAPAILSVAGVVKSGVDAFNALPPGLKSLAAGALAGTVALTGLVGAAGLLLPVLLNIRSALFVLGAGLNPIGLAVVGVAAAIGIATAAMANMQKQSQRTSAELKTEKGDLNRLVAEYDTLAAKTKKSADEKKRMQEILSKIDGIAPDVISGYDGMGKALGISRGSLEKYNTALEHQINLLYQAAEAEKARARQAVATEKVKLADLKGELARAQQELNGAMVTSPARFTDPTGRTAPVETNAVKELRDRIQTIKGLISEQAALVRQSQTDYTATHGRKATPKPVPTGGGGNGGGNGGGTGTGTGSGSSSTADPAHDAAVKRIGALNQAYQDNLRIAHAWGGGTAAEVKGLQKLLGDLRKEGLDKVAEGQDVIREATVRLREIQGEQVTKAKADAEAYNAELSGQFKGLQALFGLLPQLAQKQREFLDAKKAEAFSKGIKEIQGDVTALAIDPSLERLANFASGLAADEEKLKRFGETIAGIQEAFKSNDGGLAGFAAATKSVGASLNTTALAVTGFTFVIGQMASIIQEGIDTQNELAKAMENFGRAARRNRAEMSGDPKIIAEANRKDSLEKLEEAIEEQRAKFIKLQGNQVWDTKTGLFGTTHRVARDATKEEFLDRNPEAKAFFDSEIERINKEFNDAIGVKSLGQTLFDIAQDTARKITEQAAKDFETAANALEKQAEAAKELKSGGRNDRGEKITLDAEKALALDKQRLANQQTRTALKEREAKIEGDLAQLKLDTEKAIADIRDEGIAQRAKTEFQDKSERIAKVMEDADKKRLDLNKQLGEVKADLTKADTEAENAIARINNQYGERIDRLNDEIDKQQKILDLLNQQAVAAARVATSSSSGGGTVTVSAAGGTGGSGPVSGGMAVGTTATNPYDGGTLVWGGEGVGWNRAATGGDIVGGVPGKDSVPTLLTPGEVVVNGPGVRAIDAMMRAFQTHLLAPVMPTPSPAMAGNYVGPTTINVYALPGQDVDSIAREVERRQDARARRVFR